MPGPSIHSVRDNFMDLNQTSSRPKNHLAKILNSRFNWAVWLLTTAQVTIFILELVRSSILTGIPIEIKPKFNPMIGPSPYVLINMGARFVPCMRNVYHITDSRDPIYFPCPNTTSLASECTLSDLCGFGGVPNPKVGNSINHKPEPNQWFRFILPIFLHAGLIHIAFNLLLQLTLARDIERQIGPFRFLLVYMSSGIFGYVLGGNYAGTGMASTGASGSLFGIIAVNLLSLLYDWQNRVRPIRELTFLLFDIIIAFILGLFPGLDNFSHIGGFLSGIVLGLCILRSPTPLRKRLNHADELKPPPPPHKYSTTYSPLSKFPCFNRQKFLHFFTGRKPLWWAWWIIRVSALFGVFVGFIILLKNFYVDRVECRWCKYLSCWPIGHWCDVESLQFRTVTR